MAGGEQGVGPKKLEEPTVDAGPPLPHPPPIKACSQADPTQEDVTLRGRGDALMVERQAS